MSNFFSYINKLQQINKFQIFNMAHYREAEISRLMNLFAFVDLEKWRGMKILEVGAGVGHIGKAFINMGFDVTSTDGRQEYVNQMKSEGRKAFFLDLDKTDIDEVGDYDIVLSFGVLYHLSNPDRHILGCTKAKILVLETVVCDSSEEQINLVREKRGLLGKDQAVNTYGCRPSPIWVEHKLQESGFSSIVDISNPNGNWSGGIYDWEVKNCGQWKHNGTNYRKMWVCER